MRFIYRSLKSCSLGKSMNLPAVPRPPACGPAGAPNARSRAPWPGLTPGPITLGRRAGGLSQVRAPLNARARLPEPRWSAPWAGPGAELARRGGPRKTFINCNSIFVLLYKNYKGTKNDENNLKPERTIS